MSDAEPPELDVSIVTLNSARWMAPFLDSLVRQGYPLERVNLLVRDNGSDGPDWEQCRREVERRGEAFRSVRVERGDNVGFGAGHNRNLERGRAPFFLVSNVDLEFQPGSIATAMAALGADGESVACREFRQQPYEHPKHYHPATLETGWCSAACVLFRRAALARVGGFEERIFLYGEDVEVSYRLRDRGYRLKYCPRAVCTHHAYAAPGEVKPQQFFGSRESNFYLRLRYGTVLQVAFGVVLQVSLWLWPRRLPRYYPGLAARTARLWRNAPYFLATRRRASGRFAFGAWGYGPRRAGAFHAAPPAPAARPLVSIVVRTHAGRLGWLREALASVANQTYSPIELVVVEDGSDHARPQADQWLASGRFAGVAYLPIPKGGRCRAGNAGLEAARGELIGFLDDDDLLYADHVETLAAALLATPACVAAYGLAFEVPTRVLGQAPFRYHEQTPALMHDQPFSRARLERRNFLPVQSVLFRRECYDRHGGFDTELEYQEDWHLWRRYAAAGDFLRVPKATSLYRVPADAMALARRNAAMEAQPPSVTAAVFGARAALRVLTLLPFLRPLYLPARRLAAWLRRCTVPARATG